jgi:hypothetical protein
MNHKFFVQFVFYTMCTCVAALILIIMRSIRCGYVYADADDTEEQDLSFTANSTAEVDGSAREEVGEMDQGRFLLARLLGGDPVGQENHYVYAECADFYSTFSIIALFISAITFLIFTGCMMVEQIEAIQTNQGKIARMKMRVGQGGTELSRVTEEFNEMFGGNSPNVQWHWFVPLPVQFPSGMHKVSLSQSQYTNTHFQLCLTLVLCATRWLWVTSGIQRLILYPTEKTMIASVAIHLIQRKRQKRRDLLTIKWTPLSLLEM